MASFSIMIFLTFLTGDRKSGPRSRNRSMRMNRLQIMIGGPPSPPPHADSFPSTSPKSLNSTSSFGILSVIAGNESHVGYNSFSSNIIQSSLYGRLFMFPRRRTASWTSSSTCRHVSCKDRVGLTEFSAGYRLQYSKYSSSSLSGYLRVPPCSGDEGGSCEDNNRTS